jgi:AcrR family transcriptional regulator
MQRLDSMSRQQVRRRMGSIRKLPGVRRRRPDAEESQRKILDAAYELFADKGYGATTLNNIAARAGVAKGLVSFHFKTKEEVFQAVVRRAIPKLDRFVPIVPVDERGMACDLFCSMMKEVYRYLVEGSEAKVILRLLVAEGRRFPELVQFYHSEVVVRGNAALSKIVELGVNRGEFAIAANESVSKILISPFVSALLWQVLFSDIEKIDPKQFFDMHMKLAFHGLMGEAD